MKKLWLPLLLLIVPLMFVPQIFAENCDANCNSDSECSAKISECQKRLDMSIAATRPHEQNAQVLEKQITDIEANIKTLGVLLDKKKKLIEINEAKFTKQQHYLNSQIRDYYKKNWTSSLEYFLVIALTGDNVGETLHNLAYRQNLIDQEKRTITNLVLELSQLNDQRKKLEDNQTWLAAKQTSLAATLAPIRKLVNEAKAYQSQLSSTVGALSARQQQLIAARLGSLNLSRSAGMTMACADDRKIDPGFGTGFAFYTFGIPHRVGMNQFGAYGRANAGQSYQDILRAYYNSISFEKRGNITMKVEGYPDMPLEQYMLGIYEVPDSWPMEALKAQAVAARSYALAFTNNGANSICTTQSCQVYKGGNKGGNWEQAVRQTEGEIMTNAGQVIKAWFSSTDGGYTMSSGEYGWSSTGWTKHTRDTSGDVSSVSDLQSKAYDRDSPCFYNAQGWRPEYNKSAWLKPEEVADIVNVIMASAYTNDWDTWDKEKVKSELRSHNESPFNRIDNVSMGFDWGTGKTTSITLSGDAGSKTFDGKTFKDYFNVRAPANIAIVGPLFNIEKR